MPCPLFKRMRKCFEGAMMSISDSRPLHGFFSLEKEVEISRISTEHKYIISTALKISNVNY